MFIHKIKGKNFAACLIILSFLNFVVPVDLYAQADVTKTDVVKSGLPAPGNITVNFKDVDILTVLNYLSEVSGVDIIPTPNVSGKVTMRLRDKPWEVALDVVARNYGYAYSREGDIIRIMPISMAKQEDPVTEVISLNHIVQEIALSKAAEDNGEGQISVSKTDYNVNKIMEAINSILDNKRGERATFVPSANAIVITAIPAKINSIRDMLAKIDKRPAQVLLEAKVVEISLADTEQLGIDWDVIITAAGARRPTTVPFDASGLLNFLPSSQSKFYPFGDATDGRTDFPILDINTTLVDPMAAATTGARFAYGTLDFSQFQAVLRMISNRSDTNILSTPRVTTLNNQKASIKVVQKVMLQQTQEAVQTADIITVEFESDEDAREIGVKLDVIPHVNEEGDIVVNLIPEVSSNLNFEELNVNNVDNTVAMTYNTREANTQIRVKDGETIFIGGLIQDNVVKTHNKVPIIGDILGDIPVIGKAVKYDAEVASKSEIVFFVTVHLVRDGMDAMDKSYTKAEYKKYHVDFYKNGKKLGLIEDKDKKEETSEKEKTFKGKKPLPLASDKKDEEESGSSGPWFDFR